MNQFVGNWQLSTITTIQSGAVTETSTYDSAGVVFSPNGARLNCIAGVPQVLPNPGQNGWYNPAAFSNPTPGTFGNCGRDNLLGPHQVNIDFSAIKDFHFTERQALAVSHGDVQRAESRGIGHSERKLGWQLERDAAFEFRLYHFHQGKHAPDSIRA